MIEAIVLCFLGVLASFIAFVALAPEEMRPEMPGEVECEGWDGRWVEEKETL